MSENVNKGYWDVLYFTKSTEELSIELTESTRSKSTQNGSCQCSIILIRIIGMLLQRSRHWGHVSCSVDLLRVQSEQLVNDQDDMKPTHQIFWLFPSLVSTDLHVHLQDVCRWFNLAVSRLTQNELITSYTLHHISASLLVRVCVRVSWAHLHCLCVNLRGTSGPWGVVSLYLDPSSPLSQTMSSCVRRLLLRHSSLLIYSLFN